VVSSRLEVASSRRNTPVPFRRRARATTMI
jgi:hypothetical protein